VVLFWEVLETGQWSLAGGHRWLRAVPLKCMVSLASSCSLSLLPGHQEVSTSVLSCPFGIRLYLITGPKQWNQPTTDWNHKPK
jgi:hypothetical protein